MREILDKPRNLSWIDLSFNLLEEVGFGGGGGCGCGVACVHACVCVWGGCTHKHSYVTQTHIHTNNMHTNKMMQTPHCYRGMANHSKVHRAADMRQITVEMCVCVCARVCVCVCVCARMCVCV